MKNILIVFTLVLFSTIYVSAQKSALDKVVLKNKSLLLGEVISYNPSTILKLEMSGEIVEISSKTIKKVIMYDKTRPNDGINLNKIYYRSNLGLSLNSYETGITFTHTFSKMWNRWLSLGAGFGIENFQLNPDNNSFPIFVEVKSYLKQSNSSPYLALKTGYGMNFRNLKNGLVNAKGGPLIEPSIGYRIGSSGMFVDIYGGVRLQTGEFEYQSSSVLSTKSYVWRRLNIGFGLNF